MAVALRPWAASLGLAVVLVVLLVAPGAAENPRRVNVLLLYSEPRVIPSTVAIDEAFRSTLEARLGGGVHFYTEFLDVSLFIDNVPQRELREDVGQDIALILCQRVPHADLPVEAPHHVHWTRAVPHPVRVGTCDPVAGLAVGRVEAGVGNLAGRCSKGEVRPEHVRPCLEGRLQLLSQLLRTLGDHRHLPAVRHHRGWCR